MEKQSISRNSLNIGLIFPFVEGLQLHREIIIGTSLILFIIFLFLVDQRKKLNIQERARTLQRIKDDSYKKYPVPSEEGGNYVKLSLGRVFYRLLDGTDGLTSSLTTHEGPKVTTRSSAQKQKKTLARTEGPKVTTRSSAQKPKRKDSSITENEKPLIVLLHGFCGSSEYLLPIINELTRKQKRRVLAIDFYGRGNSDCADVYNSEPKKIVYNVKLFTDQVFELLDLLKETNTPFDLIGYSMGGAVAVEYAGLYPEQIASLVLIAPAGLPGFQGATGLQIMLVRFLRALSFHLYGIPYIEEKIIKKFLFDVHIASPRAIQGGWHDLNSERWKWYCPMMLKRYYVKEIDCLITSATSSLLDFEWNSISGYEKIRKLYHDKYDKKAKNQTMNNYTNNKIFPIYTIWGDNDIVVPNDCDGLQKLLPHAICETFKNHTHYIAIEYAELCAENIEKFWKKNE